MPEVETKTETLSTAVKTVLSRSKNGLTAREILTKLADREGGAQPTGKTPAATIQALLSTSNKNDGPFVRIDRGKYRLRAVATTAAATTA